MAMELTCTENMSSTNFAKKDSTIFNDPRVVQNLLKAEGSFVAPCNYFENVQTDIAPFMRNVVATWMMEVCEEQMCEEQVFPLAVNFMDRFLCVCPIKRHQLQLLGATCLLIASKIRSTTVLTIDLLCAYTDYSVTFDHIMSWELLVLSKLEWNMASITGFDFVDQVTERFPWGNENGLLRRHAHTLVAICYTDPTLIQTPPSLISSACICSAMRGLRMSSTGTAMLDICTLLSIDPISLEILGRFVDKLIERGMPNGGDKSSGSSSSGCEPVVFDSAKYGQPETPTDVQNIYF